MERFLRAIEFMEAHLFEAPTLKEVASAAALSPYHFSRAFRILTGEGVMDYMRRRRLTIATQRLVDEDIRLIDLAMESGFESQEAFTRAFKRQFHMTPGAWRKAGRRLMSEAFAPPDLSHLEHRKDKITMEPKFVETEEVTVVGITRRFTGDTKSGIPDLWSEFGPRMGEIEGRLETCTYGVCFPFEMNEDEFEYMAAAPVSAAGAVPDGMEIRTIPAHKYAVFTHKMGSDTIHNDLQKTVHYIWGTWLPNSGYEHDSVPDFELYDHRMNPETGEGEFDIYIPVK